MGLSLKIFSGRGSFPHGVHPPERKSFAAEAPIEVVPSPDKVLLPLWQNIGAPCEPIVKPKQDVSFGEMVGKGSAFVSAPLHASISGKVGKMAVTTLPTARRIQAIPIKSEGNQIIGQALWDEILGGEWPTDGLENYDLKEIVDAIHDAGIVGLGGAAFPTHVKLMPNDKKPLDTVLINGCECEPYLTSDYRLMIETPGPVITGALLIGRATRAKKVIIGIEDNKPKAVEVLRKAAEGTKVKIAVLKTKYPQGGEKQLIMAVLNRKVPLGGLPLDIGVAVNNVGTAAAIAGAVIRRKPLTHRVVCVSGAGITQPKNLFVPIGISFGELIDYCGGLTKDAARMIAGGPMMGFAFANPDTPVTKGTSGLTILTHEDIRKADETACVCCGRCVDVCPMNLVPTKLAAAARYKNLELADKYNIMGCLECGACAYICPASIPLVQLIRTGKILAAQNQKK